MEHFAYGATFLFGLAIGSFLNVFIYRLHTGRSTNGRSHCLSCGSVLRSFELIPVLSYVAVGGKCRKCRARIPIRYVLVESVTGALFVLVWHVFQGDVVLLFLNFVIVSLLVAIFVYDLLHYIIPDELVIGLLACVLGILGYEAFTLGVSHMLWHILSGLLGALFLGSLWFFSGGRWMGFGDVKLIAPLAALTGPSGAPAVIVLSFWIGAALSLLIIGIQYFRRMLYSNTHVAKYRKYLTIKSEVPFAPFLILGFVYVYFFHLDIFDIISVLAF